MRDFKVVSLRKQQYCHLEVSNKNQRKFAITVPNNCFIATMHAEM